MHIIVLCTSDSDNVTDNHEHMNIATEYKSNFLWLRITWICRDLQLYYNLGHPNPQQQQLWCIWCWVDKKVSNPEEKYVIIIINTILFHYIHLETWWIHCVSHYTQYVKIANPSINWHTCTLESKCHWRVDRPIIYTTRYATQIALHTRNLCNNDQHHNFA